MTRKVLAVGALVLGLVALPSSAGASGPMKLKAGDQYVALGSSIPSGFGISVQSTDGCGRSTRNYPQLVAARYDLELIDVTCGAASIPHIVDTPQGDHPIQIDAVTPATKLITVNIGGNDVGYNGTAVGCGNPATVCSAPVTLEADFDRAEVALGDLLDRLETAAPDATIVFVTYPREIPRTGNCDALGFADEEADLLRSMGERLEAMFVDVAKRPGILFVDPYVARGEHTGCASAAKAWTAGHDVAEGDGFPYHPTVLGHEVMAKMIFKALKKAK